MTFYEFQVVYSSDGKVLFCQWTGNEDETRPLSVWLGNCAGKNVVSKWYRSDEYISNGFWSFRAEQLVDKFDNQVWIAYHESGSYYDTSLEEYTENYREEQIRKHISLN
jgi:hypothetical protein